MERATGIEPATFSLARRRSTTEPRPHIHVVLGLLVTDALDESLQVFTIRGAAGRNPALPNSAPSLRDMAEFSFADLGFFRRDAGRVFRIPFDSSP